MVSVATNPCQNVLIGYSTAQRQSHIGTLHFARLTLVLTLDSSLIYSSFCDKKACVDNPFTLVSCGGTFFDDFYFSSL